MRESIIKTYNSHPPEVRAALLPLHLQLLWAADNDPEILPFISSTPPAVDKEGFSRDVKTTIVADKAEAAAAEAAGLSEEAAPSK